MNQKNPYISNGVKFAKTLGHERQKVLFSQAWQNGRMSHAYALVGQEHLGKTTFALDLATILGAEPVLDTVLLEGEVSVEQARTVQSRLSLTSPRGYKIAIIQIAENLSHAAANCLLKTLEEPPANSVIFLITANFHALFPTLASRVQRINFGRVSDAEVRLSLAEFDLSEAKLSEIVKLAQGRIGMARRLVLTPELLEQWEIYKKYYQILETGSLVQRLQTAEAVASLETPEIRSFLKFVAAAWCERGTSKMLAQKLNLAYRDLEMNVNVKLALDNLFLP